ncbi:MAG TPA: Gfo/Idh/MocA family oxidoreductase [Bryobacteraceae bacterium]|jgi:predicted dehydrogenase|nr:Gfo/Idh/MocA family oxidoreductase [Bryobacteraceae bacterium]
MKIPSRRGFLFTTTAAVVASRALPVLGANERINVALIGIGGRGQDHLQEYSRQPNCSIAAVCDVNQAARERAVAFVERAQGHKPKTYTDMRQVFEDREIHAVSFATPNHWHALGTIWACQAGKDVYVEKPACHNIFEGRKMIEAARKYKRMVQVGSQGRSQGHKRKAVEALAQGIIGQVYEAKGLCFNPRKSIGHTPDTPVPPGIDWDRFLGPAPMRPFSENRYHYNWHWFWDTGNGDIGNQGAHEMDVARWGMQNCGLPTHVVSTGGKFVYQDDQETPNTQYAALEYGPTRIVFDVRGLITPGEGDVRRGNHFVGNIFFGSEGYLTLDPSGYRVYKGPKRELVDSQKAMEVGSETAPHVANFLAAVRSRNYKELNAEVEIGVTSATLCHLANISYRTGRRLAVDPATWRFVGDEEANQLLTRNYRAPYIVPDAV